MGHARRTVTTAFVLAGLVACALPARAQEPVPRLPKREAPARSHTRAYVALGAGLALTVGSFLVAEEADRAYERYLGETDPARIEDHYDRARSLDRVSAGMLIAGQAGMALGLYWRFIHRPKSDARFGTLGSQAPAGADAPAPDAGFDVAIAPALSHRHAGVVLLARWR